MGSAVPSIRLQVHLSRAGVLSRRRAEAAIAEGRVSVNGEVVDAQGVKVDPEIDLVELDGEPVGRPQPAATIMLHKPYSVLTTLDDPQNRATVGQLVADEPYHFVPVGRLDYHTEGLLLMTTDGSLIHRLLHPRFHVSKGYRVKVTGQVGDRALDRLRDGITLEDGPTRPAIVEVLERTPRTSWLEFVVSEGRNRLVRRMCEAVGHPARRVIRLEFGTLELGDLRPGQYRYLSVVELEALYRTAQLSPRSPPSRFAEVGTARLGATQRGRGPFPGQPHRRPGSPKTSSVATQHGSETQGRNLSPRRRIAPKGKAQRPDHAPVEDERLGLRPKPEPRIEVRPDGVPVRRAAGYPDTRVWRSERTRTGNRVSEDVPRATPPKPRRRHEGRSAAANELGHPVQSNRSTNPRSQTSERSAVPRAGPRSTPRGGPRSRPAPSGSHGKASPRSAPPWSRRKAGPRRGPRSGR
ncbi:MAG: pseudouridine synthase [Myxococcota bacterium]